MCRPPGRLASTDRRGLDSPARATSWSRWAPPQRSRAAGRTARTPALTRATICTQAAGTGSGGRAGDLGPAGHRGPGTFRGTRLTSTTTRFAGELETCHRGGRHRLELPGEMAGSTCAAQVADAAGARGEIDPAAMATVEELRRRVRAGMTTRPGVVAGSATRSSALDRFAMPPMWGDGRRARVPLSRSWRRRGCTPRYGLMRPSGVVSERLGGSTCALVLLAALASGASACPRTWCSSHHPRLAGAFSRRPCRPADLRRRHGRLRRRRDHQPVTGSRWHRPASAGAGAPPGRQLAVRLASRRTAPCAAGPAAATPEPASGARGALLARRTGAALAEHAAVMLLAFVEGGICRRVTSPPHQSTGAAARAGESTPCTGPRSSSSTGCGRCPGLRVR